MGWYPVHFGKVWVGRQNIMPSGEDAVDVCLGIHSAVVPSHIIPPYLKVFNFQVFS